MHFHDRLVPSATLDMLAKIRQEVPGRGAHTLTGPIYVEGAEPGDVRVVVPCAAAVQVLKLRWRGPTPPLRVTLG